MRCKQNFIIMDNDSTRLLNNQPNISEQTTQKDNDMAIKENSEKKSKGIGKTVATAAGAFVGGAAVGLGTSAFATANPDAVDAPDPEQAILANDEGVRYAHVDADNFADAFAQARQQVGPGGVFEYNGNLYGTYTAEEWNNMSSEERNDYQNKISDVAPDNSEDLSHNQPHNSPTHQGVNPVDGSTPEPTQDNAELSPENQEPSSELVPENVELIAEETTDNEIRVLGVETVQDGSGNIMNVAIVESEGDQALLVDVDNNGSIDVLLHDDNADGQIQESEIYDISDAGIGVDDLIQSQIPDDADAYYASNDDMPDYVNDADLTMTV